MQKPKNMNLILKIIVGYIQLQSKQTTCGGCGPFLYEVVFNFLVNPYEHPCTLYGLYVCIYVFLEVCITSKK